MTDEAKLHYMLKNRRLNKGVEMLLGMITGMIADGQINDLEIKMLNTWLAEHQDVAAAWPGSLVAQKLREILQDGMISEPERIHFLSSLQQLAGNDFAESGSSSAEVTALPYDEVCPIILHNAKICLTGDFLFGTRTRCEEVSTLAGAILRNAVTGKTDLLVVGTHVSPSWAHTAFGRKIQQAMEIQRAGSRLKIISEQRWHRALAC